jgi:hypothetical protein
VVLRAALSALADALKRATKPNRSYASTVNAGKKSVIPPAPRIVNRLEKYLEMMSVNKESKQKMRSSMGIS